MKLLRRIVFSELIRHRVGLSTVARLQTSSIRLLQAKIHIFRENIPPKCWIPTSPDCQNFLILCIILYTKVVKLQFLTIFRCRDENWQGYPNNMRKYPVPIIPWSDTVLYCIRLVRPPGAISLVARTTWAAGEFSPTFSLFSFSVSPCFGTCFDMTLL